MTWSPLSLRASLFASLLTAPLAAGLAAGLALGCGNKDSASPANVDAGAQMPRATWLRDDRVTVSGHDLANENCRTGICRHNENTDLVRFKGAIYLVHRTAMSQILGPNSALHVYRSTDSGKTFSQTALIPAPTSPLSADDKATAGRDLRDPHFYVVGDRLVLKALTRLPVLSGRDSNVDTIAVSTSSTDGEHFDPITPVAPVGFSLWRIKEHAGIYYSAAYQDGDQSVTLFSSTDGAGWKKGAVIYDRAADTPLETELEFMPSGKMLALVRMDGTDEELLGQKGRLRTKVCWASPSSATPEPPMYASFACPTEITGQRLDGPVTYFWKGRLFVVARRHQLGVNQAKKRTTLFELTGDFDGGPLAIKNWGDFPSAGDTAYAGVVALDDTHTLVSWYSGDLDDDEDWFGSMLNLTDIRQGTIDHERLK